MARIPVERREGGGTPWWLWLIGAVLLIGVIWLLAEAFTGRDEVDVGVTDPPVVTDQGVATGPAITTPSTLFEAPDARALAGRPVELADMRVEEVVDGNVFWVTATGLEEDRRLLVAVTGQQAPGQPGVAPGTPPGTAPPGAEPGVTAPDATAPGAATPGVTQPGQPGVEGVTDVQVGQVVTIYGYVRELETTEADAWGLTQQQMQDFQDQQIYVDAYRLEDTPTTF